MDWREAYEQAAARYTAGETREPDGRQLVQLGNAAWAAGLCLLQLGERDEGAEWLRRAAARYRESWDAGAPLDAWGRPIAAIKALLIAGEDAVQAARWALEVRAAEAESPIGRYAATLALLVLGRDEEAAAVAATLGDDFPQDVATRCARSPPTTPTPFARRSRTSAVRSSSATRTSRTCPSRTRGSRSRRSLRGAGSRASTRRRGRSPRA